MMVTVVIYFTLIINSLFLILGFLNMVTGAILFRYYLLKQEFVDAILIVVPGVTMLLGLFTILFALLGCFGMPTRNRRHSIIYFTATIIIICTELSLGSWWCYEYRSHNKFPLLKLFFLMEKETFYDEEWMGLQVRENCCGVNDVQDYVRNDRIIPRHCCQMGGTLRMYHEFTRMKDCHPADVVKPGCKSVLERSFRRDQVVLIVQLLTAGIIKATLLIAAFFIPFKEKHIYDSPPFAEPSEEVSTGTVTASADMAIPGPAMVVEPPALIPIPGTVVVVAEDFNLQGVPK